MPNYFDKFPKIAYQINKDSNRTKQFTLATNIMVRVRVLVEKLDQVFHYYPYTIKDGDKPEILAEKFYGDAEAHWLILLTNNITDPIYDWPMPNDIFDKYIIAKYGSLAIAQTTYHHYEIVYQTYDVTTRNTSYNRIQVAQNPLSNVTINNAGRGYAANGNVTISTNYGVGANIAYTINANGSIISLNITSPGSYVAAPNLSVEGANTSIAILSSFVATSNLWSDVPTDIGSYSSNLIGQYVVNAYLPYRNSVTNYDWEFEQNEARRTIKLIKPDYYTGIKSEFSKIMADAGVGRFIPGIRTVT